MYLKNIELLEILGEGTYGIVYKARDKTTDEFLAVKKVKFQDKENGIPSTTIREASILKTLSHKNIIQLKKIIFEEDEMYLVFEYIEYDLKNLITNRMNVKKFFSESKVRKLSKQLLEAVAYCHSNSIFHRDIKPHNILITKDLVLKLADFGMARSVSIPLRKYTPEIVTLWYRAPEVLTGAEFYDYSVDIWSVACIIYEIYTLEILFQGDSEVSQLKKIYSILGTPSAIENEEIINKDVNVFQELDNFVNKGLNLENKMLENLLTSMLKLNPLERITAEDALLHEYFSIK